MRAALRRLGNSSGLIIPKSMLTELGVAAGDTVEMTLEQGRIVLAPIKRAPREGWSTASQALAEAEDDALVWPEFGNIDDALGRW